MVDKLNQYTDMFYRQSLQEFSLILWLKYCLENDIDLSISQTKVVQTQSPDLCDPFPLTLISRTDDMGDLNPVV